MSIGEFAASLLIGLVSVLLPLAIFFSMVAVGVFVARWWNARKS